MSSWWWLLLVASWKLARRDRKGLWQATKEQVVFFVYQIYVECQWTEWAICLLAGYLWHLQMCGLWPRSGCSNQPQQLQLQPVAKLGIPLFQFSNNMTEEASVWDLTMKLCARRTSKRFSNAWPHVVVRFSFGMGLVGWYIDVSDGPLATMLSGAFFTNNPTVDDWNPAPVYR